MLKSLRSGAKSTPMRIFLVILAIGFGLWGFDSGFGSLGQSSNAVEVGTVEVTAVEAAREFDRTRRNFMPNTSTSEAVASGLLSNVVSGIAQRSLFIAEARRMDLTVTREMEKRTIASEPAFKDEIGQFSTIRFQDTLARVGLSEQGYLDFLRNMLMRTQLMDAINGGIRYPEASAREMARWRLERRVISHATIAVDTDAVETPGEAEILEWYGKNSSTFDSPDLRHVTVAITSPEAFLDQVEITADAVEAAYEERRDLYQTPERRNIKQMIFSSADEAMAAIGRIKSGEDFAAVAGAMLNFTAEDTNLGDLSRDDLTEDLADAAFALTEPGLAEPVETALGHHVILVDKIIDAFVVPLEDARESLLDELTREAATDLVYQRITELEDALASGQTIEEAARASGSMLVTINGMDRNGLDADGNPIDGIATDTGFREAIWTALVGEPGMVEESGADSFYVARVDREEAARSRDLSEVRARVITAIKREAAISRARARAAAVAVADDPLAAASKDNIRFSEDISVRRDGVGMDHEAARLIASHAFTLEEGKTSFVETGNEAILVTTKTVEAAPDDTVNEEATLFQRNLTGELLQSVDLAVIRSLEKRFDVRVNPNAVQQLLIGASN